MKRKTNRSILGAGALALLGLLLFLGGCRPPGPDLTPFAEAIKWLGVCLVLSSLIWAVGIVLFGQNRK